MTKNTQLNRGIFTILLTSVLVLLASCFNVNSGNDPTEIPDSAVLTGYSNIDTTKDTAIANQIPDPPAGEISFTYSMAPTVPDGLMLDQDTGVLSGAPTTPQISTDYIITATAVAPYTGSVNAAISIRVSEAIPGLVELTGYSNIDTTKDTAIASQIPDPPAGEISFTYSMTPTVPDGLMLDQDTGVLSGAPTTPQISTDYIITATAVAPYTGSVNAAISIRVSEAIPGLVELTGYSNIDTTKDTTIASQIPDPPAGEISFTYSMAPTVPDGLMLDQDTGVLSGAPTTPQISTDYIITATAVAPYTGSVNAAISIRVSEAIPGLVELTGYSNIDTTKDTAIASQIPDPPAGEISFTYSMAPTVPDGLMLDQDTGVLSGAPTTPQISTDYIITATAVAPYTGSVNAAISIRVSEAIPGLVELTGYSNIDTTKDTAIASQIPDPPAGEISFTYSMAPTVPDGLMLDPDTGVLSGAPTTPQISTDYIITATAVAPYTGSVNAAISIRVSEAIPGLVELTGYSNIDTTKDTAIANQIPNTPAEEISFTYSMAPTVPDGLMLDPDTGVLSGAPTTPQISTDYIITATAVAPYTGSVNAAISIRVSEAIPGLVELTGYSNIDTTKDTAIANQIPNTPAEEISFTYSMAPTVPDGLMLDPDTGVLSGAPTTPQISTDYIITATAVAPYTGSVNAAISIRVSEAIPGLVELTGYSNIDTTKDTAIANQIPDPPAGEISFTYSMAPTVPDGLMLDPDTGVLSGAPTTPQISTDYIITATAVAPYTGSVNAAISIRVSEAIPGLAELTGYSNIDTTKDTAIASQIPDPPAEEISFTYSMTPTVPDGLMLDQDTGVLSGAPTTPQISTDYIITATAVAPYTGSVNAAISIRVSGTIPTSVELIGYTDIRILKDTPIAEQNPALSNPPEGGINFTYSISPNPLPNGLVFNPNTGALSGSPTTQQEPENYTITATAMNPYTGTLDAEIFIIVYKVQASDRNDLENLIEAELAATDGSVNLIDTSLVVDMSLFFSGKTDFNEDISGWDVSNVTNMLGMFRNATTFNQDLNDWDITSVTSLNSMFNGATAFNGDISGWKDKFISVTDMDYMFRKAESFNADISDWNTSNIRVMAYMFEDATSFNRDISDWDVSSAVNIRSMFQGATAFDQDLENWNVSLDAVVIDMFKDSGMTSLPSWYN